MTHSIAYPNLEKLPLKKMVTIHNKLDPHHKVKAFRNKAQGVIRLERIMRATAASWDADALEVDNFTPVPASPRPKEIMSKEEVKKNEAKLAKKREKEEKERKAKLKTEDETPTPPPAGRKRRPRIILRGDEVIEPTGDNSRIGKGIHLEITNAFNGKTPVSKVVDKLVKSLNPPRAKGWEEDPHKYVREYVTYNIGQGALRIVG